MKSIFLALLLIFPAIANAQDQAREVTAPDLRVIKVKLDPIVQHDGSSLANLPGWDRETPRPVGASSNFVWQAKAELEVQNTGNRTIKSFDWQLSLTVGTGSEQRTQKHRVQSKKVIKPGQTVKVIAGFKNNYLKELSNPQQEGLLQGQAEIKLIKYEDGKIWVPMKKSPNQ